LGLRKTHFKVRKIKSNKVYTKPGGNIKRKNAMCLTGILVKLDIEENRIFKAI